MEQWKRLMRYFSRSEKLLWGGSVGLILAAFLLFDRGNYLTLTASLIGVTALIFVAKANPFGQFLVIVFSVLYGIISYSFAYYGEMITYLGMTLPMAVFSLITWIRNPYQGNHAEVCLLYTSCRYHPKSEPGAERKAGSGQTGGCGGGKGQKARH